MKNKIELKVNNIRLNINEFDNMINNLSARKDLKLEANKFCKMQYDKIDDNYFVYNKYIEKGDNFGTLEELTHRLFTVMHFKDDGAYLIYAYTGLIKEQNKLVLSINDYEIDMFDMYVQWSIIGHPEKRIISLGNNMEIEYNKEAKTFVMSVYE